MDKNLYLLAEFDEATQIKFREFEEIIIYSSLSGTQTKNIPYHITLGSFSSDCENYLVNMLDEIGKIKSAFDLTFSSLGLFGLKVLFLNPDMSRELIELHDFTKGKSLHRDDSLAAHATVLIDEPENILKILPPLAEKFRAFRGKIRYVSLYEFFPARFIGRTELRDRA